MTLRPRILLLLSFIPSLTHAAEPPFTGTNPIPYTYQSQGAEHREVRDPCIIREGDAWYLIHTMWPFANREPDRMNLPDNGSSPGIALYRSTDLKDWKFQSWLVRSADLPDDCPYKHRFWAPEIHKLNGKFYLIFTADNWTKKEINPHQEFASAGRAFVGVADHIGGPYQHISLIPDGACDTTLFADTTGKTYAVMPKHDLFIRPIDLTGLTRGEGISWLGPEKKIVTCDPAGTKLDSAPEYLEGPWVEHIGGRYHLFYAEFFRNGKDTSYWTGVASADTPDGPWQRDDRGKVFEAGHIAIFDGPSNSKWVSYRIENRDHDRGLLAIDPVTITPQGQVQVEITAGKR
ncbi:glycoside hydrolase family 43 protein [Luteolibacter soli]|uniref:Family 43 glycosylhydrolase n=1 Tax=Luteolibacter soli TaxID=3135280 RepID=A0ABU9AXK7_9BACT